MDVQQVKVIVKIEQGRPLLFFPESPANHGRMECWDGAHCEADMGYFWSLRNPQDNMEHRVSAVLANYAAQYQVAGPFQLQRVRRDTDKMRRARWSQA